MDVERPIKKNVHYNVASLGATVIAPGNSVVLTTVRIDLKPELKVKLISVSISDLIRDRAGVIQFPPIMGLLIDNVQTFNLGSDQNTTDQLFFQFRNCDQIFMKQVFPLGQSITLGGSVSDERGFLAGDNIFVNLTIETEDI